MARGAEGKARRKEQKKLAREEAAAILEGNTHDFGPGEEEEEEETTTTTTTPTPNVTEEDNDDLGIPLPKKKKKKSSSRNNESKYTSKAMKAAGAETGSKSGIKTAPLVLLLLMTGSTLIPGLIYASDFLGSIIQKHHILGSIGFRLGIGATPKKRVLSFYEKHDPTKLDEVPKILAKYYGDYPKLTKKLERKYQDYGYFLGWEEDEAPMTLAFEQLHETRMYLVNQWNRYAPQILKTAVRNIQYNVGTLIKKFRKFWKKTIWPFIEPIFGVPKGAAAQKRKDAQEARSRKSETTGTKRRRRNTEYRDDMEDEH